MKDLFDNIKAALHFGGMKKDIVFLIISGAALLISISLPKGTLPFDPAWIAIILCGVPMMIEALIGIITEFNIKAGVLVSIALIASVCIGEYFAAGEVAFIMLLGTIIEDSTVAKARAGIERLVSLSPHNARIVADGKESVVNVEEVRENDILRVLPGDMIPVDGIIVSGDTSVDESIMTGEPIPVDKTAGDEVISGTINRFGAFEMRASRIGEDSSVQRMIRLVQSADANKTRIASIADRWATGIVLFALSCAVLTMLVTGELIRAVTILVVFCPCALVLATPTAITAAIGNLTEHGFLVKDPNALERLAAIRKVFFDKTGTLTRGKPAVTKICSVSELSENEIFAYTAAAEQYSGHPLGRAVTKAFRDEFHTIPSASDFAMTAGKGVRAVSEGMKILAGNERFIHENGIRTDGKITDEAAAHTQSGGTVIYTAVNGSLAGYIVLADTLRSESSDMIARLHALGIESILLTGDRSAPARVIAEEAGVSALYSECLPADKLSLIEKAQSKGRSAAMVGDGINDAPALKTANVGIAMGAAGSDIAADAADIAIVRDEIGALPHLFALSRRMINTIRINLTFSMTVNLVSVVLAFTGAMTPVAGALVHNAGSTLVVLHSALLLLWRRRNEYKNTI